MPKSRSRILSHAASLSDSLPRASAPQEEPTVVHGGSWRGERVLSAKRNPSRDAFRSAAEEALHAVAVLSQAVASHAPELSVQSDVVTDRECDVEYLYRAEDDTAPATPITPRVRMSDRSPLPPRPGHPTPRTQRQRSKASLTSGQKSNHATVAAPAARTSQRPVTQRAPRAASVPAPARRSGSVGRSRPVPQQTSARAPQVCY